jgi:hypothetical protein
MAVRVEKCVDTLLFNKGQFKSINQISILEHKIRKSIFFVEIGECDQASNVNCITSITTSKKKINRNFFRINLSQQFFF